jgi:hypothetical protein
VQTLPSSPLLIDLPPLKIAWHLLGDSGFAPKRQRWIACRKEYFLPVRVLGRHFRRIFLELLLKAYRQGYLQFYGELAELQDSRRYAAWIRKACGHKWIVYAKKLFGGPQQVLDYLGRYTHRVAISNHRITNIADGKVTFSWRDYRTEKLRLMTLEASEFIRRFLQHVLPDGYVRIRHFGLLANRNRSSNLEKARQLLASGEGQSSSLKPQMQPQIARLCPHCGRGFLAHLIPSTNEPQGCDSS